MHKYQVQFTQAQALRAAIVDAPNVWLPRRAVLLDWLNEFLVRVDSAAYELSKEDTADLDALHGFLRAQHVPLA